MESAATIAGSIIADLAPSSVFDVGCGTGALLEALATRGCSVAGLEYSEAALAYCRRRALDVRKFDLEHDDRPADLDVVRDVVVSMEVAEHLPGSVAGRFIKLLTSLGETVVFTAAPPGQGGTDHVNEQPRSYWVSNSSRRAVSFSNENLTDRWQGQWQASGAVPEFYWANLMVFQANGRSAS